MTEGYWYGLLGGICATLLALLIRQAINDWKGETVKKSPDGVVDYVLQPQQYPDNPHEVMLFQCSECPEKVTNVHLEPHAILHDAYLLTVDIRAAKPV